MSGCLYLLHPSQATSRAGPQMRHKEGGWRMACMAHNVAHKDCTHEWVDANRPMRVNDRTARCLYRKRAEALNVLPSVGGFCIPGTE